MNIRFNPNGQILACGMMPAADSVITVDDKDIPQDLLRTFALGKYSIDVEKKQLIENKEFKMPERRRPEEMQQVVPVKEEAKPKRKTTTRKKITAAKKKT